MVPGRRTHRHYCCRLIYQFLLLVFTIPPCFPLVVGLLFGAFPFVRVRGADPSPDVLSHCSGRLFRGFGAPPPERCSHTAQVRGFPGPCVGQAFQRPVCIGDPLLDREGRPLRFTHRCSPCYRWKVVCFGRRAARRCRCPFSAGDRRTAVAHRVRQAGAGGRRCSRRSNDGRSARPEL